MAALPQPSNIYLGLFINPQSLPVPHIRNQLTNCKCPYLYISLESDVGLTSRLLL